MIECEFGKLTLSFILKPWFMGKQTGFTFLFWLPVLPALEKAKLLVLTVHGASSGLQLLDQL